MGSTWGLISRVSSRTYRFKSEKMIREKLSIFDKRIEKEGIFIDIDVDKYETLETINSKEQITSTTNQPDEQQNNNSNNQFSSASSGSEEEEPQEKIILCTKCNIELPL